MAMVRRDGGNGVDDNGDEVAVVVSREERLPAVSEATPAPVIAAIARSDALAQLDAAHRYPRSVSRFLAEAKTLATMTADVAASCIYSLPRGGKQIVGPSVRLAELCAAAYGHLQFGARVIDTDESFVTAQGICWDMQSNNRATIEVRRRITKKDGKRYDEDMIGVAGAAACSIALRNAIFRVVPRAYVDVVYEQARRVAVGDATTLDVKRAALFRRLNALGVTNERILACVGKAGVEDVGLTEVEKLIGLGSAIKDGAMEVDEAFPPVQVAPPAAPPEGQRIRMTGAKRAEPAAAPPSAPATAQPAPAPEPAAEPAAPADALPGDPSPEQAREFRAQIEAAAQKGPKALEHWREGHGEDVDALPAALFADVTGLWSRFSGVAWSV